MSFKGKVVIVTGASSGIGAATAVMFAKEGADVTIVGRNEVRLNSVADQCAKYGRTPLAIIADVANEEETSTIVDKTIKQFGKLDVLVNNAGSAVYETILGGNLLQAYDKTMNTNLRSTVQLTSLAAPHLVETKGNIINISSVNGSMVNPDPTFIAYCTSKAAMDHFTRCAALELAAKGVRVNGICPGPVSTNFLEATGKHREWDDVGKKITILKRVSDSEEIAEIILFVASSKGRGITGENILVDNGMILKRDIEN